MWHHDLIIVRIPSFNILSRLRLYYQPVPPPYVGGKARGTSNVWTKRGAMNKYYCWNWSLVSKCETVLRWRVVLKMSIINFCSTKTSSIANKNQRNLCWNGRTHIIISGKFLTPPNPEHPACQPINRPRKRNFIFLAEGVFFKNVSPFPNRKYWWCHILFILPTLIEGSLLLVESVSSTRAPWIKSLPTLLT